jgi:YjzC-like protein
MDRETFKPGETAPESGIYRVVHHAHRLPHDVTIEKGMTFPECGRCGDHARFVYLQTAPFVRDDYDFRSPQKKRANSE